MHTDQGSDHMTSHPPMKVSVINIYENRFIQYTCIPHYIGPGSSTCMFTHKFAVYTKLKRES